jgi:hypothetical protein
LRAELHRLGLQSLQMDASSEPSTGDASPPHKLELDATYMAATRTLFAMVRTGAIVAGGGIAVTDLLVEEWPRWVVVTLSSAFSVLGCWLMWAALKKGRQLRTWFEVTGKEVLFPHWQFMAMTLTLQVLILTVLVLYLLGQ